MRPIPIICLVVFLVVSGCTTLKDQFDKFFGAEDTVTAQELAWEGMDAYESGRYSKAIEKFQKLKDYYPFSKYAILAELKIADAHYQRDEYEEAIFAYENFEQLHPRNEAIPYVIYQIGRCYYDRIDTPDRDQTSARKALETFQRLIKQFPRDQYSIRAAEHIKTAQKSLAGHADFATTHRFYLAVGRDVVDRAGQVSMPIVKSSFGAHLAPGFRPPMRKGR